MPASCWEPSTCRSFTNWFIDHLRESQRVPSRTRDEGTGEAEMSVGPLYRAAPTVAVLAALCLPVTAEGQSWQNRNPRFELYTRSAVEIAARSRLRGARIFDGLVRSIDLRERESPMLRVFITGYEPVNSFSIQLVLYKPVRDTLSGASGMAITWQGITSVGHHAGDGGYVLQSHAQRMDEFIDQYLAANDRACG